MKQYLLISLLVLSIGVSACYRDNYRVTSFSASDKSYSLSFMHKGDELFYNGNSVHFEENNAPECINQVVVGQKIPDCMIDFIKRAAAIE